jgi:hypothetical protein
MSGPIKTTRRSSSTKRFADPTTHPNLAAFAAYKTQRRWVGWRDAGDGKKPPLIPARSGMLK